MTIEAPCANPGCPHPGCIAITSEVGTLYLCLDDTARVQYWCNHSRGTVGQCVICHTSTTTYQVSSPGAPVLFLCRGHTITLLSYCLAPQEILDLSAIPGLETAVLLSQRYYDTRTGRPLLPCTIGTTDIQIRLTAMRQLPTDFPLELLQSLQEDFTRITGLEMDEQLARLSLAHLIAAEDRRRASCAFPSSPRRDEVRGHLLAIFQDEDPQGVVALSLEPVPYVREAAYLAQILCGELTETPERILPNVVMAFGGDKENPSQEDCGRYRSLARTISTEICAPLAAERLKMRI